MAPAIPKTVGTYKVVRLLGEGGMGRVFACVDPGLDREVAIKVLRPDVAANPEMSERFLREARSMAKVTSPHVVTVHQVGEDETLGPFLVMELVAGRDVGKELRPGGIAIDDAIDMIRQAAKGLVAASEAGLVHRDIKPENLFRTKDVIKVADFGLARPLDGSAKLTQDGVIVGTPHYMAPEIGRGEPASQASDMYALGATFFELLTGRPPFVDGSAVEVLAAHMLEPAPTVESLRAEVTASTSGVVDKMLAKDPNNRFQTYGALLDALSQPASNAMRVAPTTTSVVAPPKTPKPNAQPANWFVVAGIGAGLFALGAIAIVFFFAVLAGETGGESVVMAAPGSNPDPRLLQLQAQVKSEKWDERHDALKEIKALGKATDEMEEKVGLMDLTLGNTCKSRRFGLLRLGRIGRSNKAITAIRDAQRDVFNNGCMALEMWSVESKVRKRQQRQSRER